MEDRDLAMRVAMLEQSSRETNRRLDKLEQVPADIAAMRVDMLNMRNDLTEFILRAEKRDEVAKADRRNFNRAALAAAVALICALIGAAAAIISAAPH